MKLREMLQGLELFARTETVTEAQIPEVEEWLGMKLGPQLREYILEYSCLGSSEMDDYFLSIVATMGKKSDMVICTETLREDYCGMENYVMLERDAIEYVDTVVDGEDNVFWIDVRENGLVPANMKLFDYIVTRIKNGTKVFFED